MNDKRLLKNDDSLDKLLKYSMLVLGGIAAISFFASLFSMIKFPGATKYLVIVMVSSAILFLILRVIYRFRIQYKLSGKEKATQK